MNRKGIVNVVTGTITVGNVRYDECTHYCGRMSAMAAKLIARRGMRTLTALGNPYPMKDKSVAERKRSILLFKRKLWNEWKEHKMESEMWQQIASIPRGAVLGCWCSPRACHCDIIVSAAEWLENRKENKNETDNK